MAVASVNSVAAGGGGAAQAVIEAQDRAVNSRNDGVGRFMLFSFSSSFNQGKLPREAWP